MSLSADMARLHDELVAEFGEGVTASWSFDVLAGGDGSTGTVAVTSSRTATSPSIYPVPLSSRQLERFVDGTSVLATDRMLTVAGSTLDSLGEEFRPAVGMRVVVSGETYVVVSVLPIGIGASVVFYLVFVRGA